MCPIFCFSCVQYFNWILSLNYYIFQPWVFIWFYFIVFNYLLIFFFILSSTSLKYMWLICLSPWLVAPIFESLLHLYHLFIFLDLGAFDLVSCYATWFFKEYLTLSAKTMKVILVSQYCYFPSGRTNLVFGRQLGQGKITSIQLVMEQMKSWVTNSVKAGLFLVTSTWDTALQSQLKVRDVCLHPFSLAYLKANFVPQDLLRLKCGSSSQPLKCSLNWKLPQGKKWP